MEATPIQNDDTNSFIMEPLHSLEDKQDPIFDILDREFFFDGKLQEITRQDSISTVFSYDSDAVLDTSLDQSSDDSRETMEMTTPSSADSTISSKFNNVAKLQ